MVRAARVSSRPNTASLRGHGGRISHPTPSGSQSANLPHPSTERSRGTVHRPSSQQNPWAPLFRRLVPFEHGPKYFKATWVDPPLLCNCTPIPADLDPHRSPGSLSDLSTGQHPLLGQFDNESSNARHAGVNAEHAATQPARMGIAYNLLLTRATPSDIPSYLRLLRAIYHEDNLVAIHLDAKAPDEEFVALKAAVEGDPRLGAMCRFVPRAPLTWAGASVMLTGLRMLSTFLRDSKDWSYWMNLSGSDYPLMTQDALRQLLGALPAPLDFVGGLDDVVEHVQTDLYDHVWDDPALTDAILRHASQGLSSPPPVLRTQGGFVYSIEDSRENRMIQTCKMFPPSYVLSRTSCEYLVNDPEGRVRDALVALSPTYASDERFYLTLLANSPRNRARLQMPLMFTKWEANAAHPNTLTEENWSSLRDSKAAFARKFLPGSSVLDRIDREILGSPVENERRVASTLKLIDSLFIPADALSFSGPGFASSAQPLRGDQQEDLAINVTQVPTDVAAHGSHIDASNCSTSYAFVSPAFLRSYNATKNDVCREPFMKRGSQWFAVKKTVGWGPQRGVTEFHEMCCPC
eukprot:jgi/Mesvir1/4505/Mv03784-RA.1